VNLNAGINSCVHLLREGPKFIEERPSLNMGNNGEFLALCPFYIDERCLKNI